MLLAGLLSDLADAKLEVARLKFKFVEVKRKPLNSESKANLREAEAPTAVGGAYSFKGNQSDYCPAC